MTMRWFAKVAAIWATAIMQVMPLTTAQAQTVALASPPIRSTIDGNGVDLQTGYLTLGESDLSIGDPANGGLTHNRRWVVESQEGTAPGDGHGTNPGWRHGYIMTVKDNYNANTTTVTIGNGTTLLFKRANTYAPWTNDQPNGWALVQSGDIYTATGPDGTIYKFDAKPGGVAMRDSGGHTFGSYYGSVSAVGTSITRPNGLVTTLTYKVGVYRYYYCSPSPCGSYIDYFATRLTSVQTNNGYQLHYGYLSNNLTSYYQSDVDAFYKIARVDAVNLAQTFCDAAADGCAGSFPAVTYTYGTNANGTTFELVTKPGGGTKKYTYWGGCNCIEGGGQILLSITDGISAQPYQSYEYYYDNGGSNYYWQKIIKSTKNGIPSLYNYWANSYLNVVDVTTDGTLGTLKLRAQIRNDKYTLDSLSSSAFGATSYSWDSYGRVTQINDPSSGMFSFWYDGRGNKITVTSYDGSNNNTIYQASFDANCTNPKTCNQPNSVTDAFGKITNFTYDPAHGGVLTVTAPAAVTGGVRPQVRTTYAPQTAYYKNSAGSIVAASSAIYLPTTTSSCITTASCAGTADEVVSTVAYGTTGAANNLLPTSSTTAAGNGSVSSTTTVSYDANGNKAVEDGPMSGSGDTTTWTYNSDRQPIQVISPDPDGSGPLKSRTVKTSYDANGQITSISTGISNGDGSGYVELSRSDTLYDSYARKIRATITAGGAVQARTDYSYDSLDRPECTAVRMNPAIFATASTSACALGTQGAFGPDRITHNVYDITDRLFKVQTAYGLPYQRDEITKTYWIGQNVASITDAKGNRTSYTYDNYNKKLIRTNYPSLSTVGQSSTTDFEQITYDKIGRPVTRQLRDGKQITYTYDNLGRQTLAHMVNPVDANDRDIATSYDLLGRVTQVDDGAGKRVNYTYDALGRKLSESPQLTGGSTTYQYDAAGRRTRLTWSDGFYVTYDYDTLGALTAVWENGGGWGWWSTPLAAFAYDDQGKVIGLTRGNGVNDAYSYDAASRLATMTVTHPTAPNTYSFSYNPAGQLMTRTMSNDAYAWTQAATVNRNYTANGLNQYTASGTVTPTYDGRGNLTSAGSTAYVYDSKNKLTNFGSNSFGYDATGRLASQATPGTRFVYDGSDLIAETDASNTILRRYVHVPGTDDVLVWYEGAGTSDRRWLAHDERGSTTLVTNDAGASLGINSYDEYGIPQTANLGRFQYTGQTWMPELGMYYYKARIYSATMGRFMQTDPTGYDDGPNWYNYVKGDPLNGTDPTGNTCSFSGKPTAEQSVACQAAEAEFWKDYHPGPSFDSGYMAGVITGSIDSPAFIDAPVYVFGAGDKGPGFFKTGPLGDLYGYWAPRTPDGARPGKGEVLVEGLWRWVPYGGTTALGAGLDTRGSGGWGGGGFTGGGGGSFGGGGSRGNGSWGDPPKAGTLDRKHIDLNLYYAHQRAKNLQDRAKNSAPSLFDKFMSYLHLLHH